MVAGQRWFLNLFESLKESPGGTECDGYTVYIYIYITYPENRRYSATIFVPHLLCVWFSERRFGKNHIEDTMSK